MKIDIYNRFLGNEMSIFGPYLDDLEKRSMALSLIGRASTANDVTQ